MSKDTRQRQDRFHTFWALLRWEGELRNGRLQRLLSLSNVQVSRLLGQFREEHPRLLELDQVGKRWVPRGTVPIPECPVDDYLGVLRAAEDDYPAWYFDGRARFQEPPPRVFMLVRKACIEGSGIEVTYGSMAHPEGKTRVIYPQSIVRLSQRWHVRAWCPTREAYRDFTFGRMRNLRLVPAPEAPLPPDIAWDTLVPLRLVPHRHLSPDLQEMVRAEYIPEAVARRFDVRAALLNYVVHDIRAAIDPEKERPPEFLLEVLNRADIEPYLFNSPEGNGYAKALSDSP